jgi:SHS2 domain-containing protein
MEGGPVDRVDKAIKAVTYHNLRIARTDRGLEATIVFDV